jgi:hypothetical protein
MRDAGEIGRHLGNLRLEALIEHLLQFVVLPPRLGHVMVGENLSIIGSQKPGAKNIKMYLGTDPCKAHQGIVGLVGLRLAGACDRRVVQFQPGIVLGKGYQKEGRNNPYAVDQRQG